MKTFTKTLLLGTRAIIVSALFLFACKSNAVIRRVPADYQTIQAAVDSAVDGDTIQIAPGVYKENVEAEKKSLILEAPKGSTGVESDILATVIDGGNNGSPALILSVTGPSENIIKGLTVNGEAPGFGFTIQKCV